MNSEDGKKRERQREREKEQEESGAHFLRTVEAEEKNPQGPNECHTALEIRTGLLMLVTAKRITFFQ